jgi:hypothetical protein
MKHHTFFGNQKQRPAGASRPTAVADLKQVGIDFAPSADEVATRADSNQMNQGSQQGYEVRNWLAAEAELIAEHNFTQVHEFHSRA